MSIISMLSSMIFASIKNARIKTRDARRMSDLSQIRTALYFWRDSMGNWIDDTSGCGNLSGNGWFSFGGNASYPKAMSKCLVDGEFTSAEIVDPSGIRAGMFGPAHQDVFAYMKYTCVQAGRTQTYVFANLESIPYSDSSTATDGTCCATCDTTYGMDYYLQIAE